MTSRQQARVEGGHASIAGSEPAARPAPACEDQDGEALLQLTGAVKWFDATRGFGFIVSEDAEGDILIHFSVLKEHDRRSLPEGAMIECLVVQQERGLQARKVISIDLSQAVVPDLARPHGASADRIDPSSLLEEAGSFEAVRVKWFNRLRGYGFLVREEDDEQESSSSWRRPARRPHRSRARSAAQGANRKRPQGTPRGRGRSALIPSPSLRAAKLRR